MKARQSGQLTMLLSMDAVTGLFGFLDLVEALQHSLYVTIFFTVSGLLNPSSSTEAPLCCTALLYTCPGPSG